MLLAKLLRYESGHILIRPFIFAEQITFPLIVDQNLQYLGIRNRQLVKIIIHFVELGMDTLHIRKQRDDLLRL